MKKYSFAAAMRAALVASLVVFAFTSRAQGIDSALIKYGAKYQQEKIYLHYDKAAYAPGETIWFKAYLLQGLYPVTESKTLYADWVDDNGTVLYHTVSPIVEGGVTNGQFEIPENFQGSAIHVRAYTKWMLNFDTAFLYSKDIRIIQKASMAKAVRPASVATIQFFPEGGDAIAGIPNRIAFKANDQWGRPVHIRGVVLGAKGNVIDSLRVLHDGMGSFMITPEAGVHYTARWKDDKGVEKTTELPAIQPQGVSMQVGTEQDKRVLVLNCSSNAPASEQELHVIGTINQQMAFKADALVQPGGNIRRVIPVQTFPSGILTITVFDKNWNAIAERISYINNHEYSFQPSMEVAHWGLNKRARDVIEVTVPDSIQASLSVSVTDAAIEKDTADNIISHLMLTADIKGYVNNPWYYFSSNTPDVAKSLDLVMLTHGWRRFKWEDVVRGKLPPITYEKDTAYLSLSGALYGIRKGQVGPSENVVLFVKAADGTPKMMVMPLESDGSFRDPNTIFFDTLNVYYQIKSKSNSNAEVRFMTSRLPAPNYTTYARRWLNGNPWYTDTTGFGHHYSMSSEEVRLAGLQKGKALENVTVTAHKKSPLQLMDEKYASGLFQSGDSYQFDLVNDKLTNAYTDIFQYLQGKVAGLQITTGGAGGTSLSWRGGTPSVYLNEVPTDVSMLSGVPVSDIAYVKVFRPPFMGGFNGSNGAIAIYTRKGGDVPREPGRGLANNTIIAYSPVKQFYSPNYDRFDPKNEQADYRTTLYWNPRLETKPGQNKITLTFYNNDVTQSFRVVIEGMSHEGLLTHYEQIME